MAPGIAVLALSAALCVARVVTGQQGDVFSTINVAERIGHYFTHGKSTESKVCRPTTPPPLVHYSAVSAFPTYPMHLQVHQAMIADGVCRMLLGSDRLWPFQSAGYRLPSAGAYHVTDCAENRVITPCGVRCTPLWTLWHYHDTRVFDVRECPSRSVCRSPMPFTKARVMRGL